jgi:hypothetical protein
MNKTVEIPELNELFYIADKHPDIFQINKLDEIIVNGINYPIYAATIGTQDKSAPTLGLFGGVHGLERIGTQVVISYLSTLSERLEWDYDLRKSLKIEG